MNISVFSPIYHRVEEDLNILGGIAADYRRAIDLIVQGRAVAKDKVGIVHDLYTLALGAAENENDMLEAMFFTGFAAAWIMFPFALLEYQSQLLLNALNELNKELRAAEREARNSKWKTAIHTAVMICEALVPELSLTVRVTIFLGDVVLDRALGPPNPTTKQRYVGITTPGVKQFSEAVEGIEKYSEGARSLAKKTGKAAVVATVYLDVHEAFEASERVDKIEELIEKMNQALEKLISLIEKNKPRLQQFLFSFDRWTRAIEDIRLTAANVRNARNEEMTRARYQGRWF
jgi:hypothetical protein